MEQEIFADVADNRREISSEVDKLKRQVPNSAAIDNLTNQLPNPPYDARTKQGIEKAVKSGDTAALRTLLKDNSPTSRRLKEIAEANGAISNLAKKSASGTASQTDIQRAANAMKPFSGSNLRTNDDVNQTLGKIKGLSDGIQNDLKNPPSNRQQRSDSTPQTRSNRTSPGSGTARDGRSANSGMGGSAPRIPSTGGGLTGGGMGGGSMGGGGEAPSGGMAGGGGGVPAGRNSGGNVGSGRVPSGTSAARSTLAGGGNAVNGPVASSMVPVLRPSSPIQPFSGAPMTTTESSRNTPSKEFRPNGSDAISTSTNSGGNLAPQNPRGISPASATTRVTLTNSERTESILYNVNGQQYDMKPGFSHSMADRDYWVVEFDRGGDFGTARYKVAAGNYKFTSTDRGWDLTKLKTRSTDESTVSQSTMTQSQTSLAP